MQITACFLSNIKKYSHVSGIFFSSSSPHLPKKSRIRETKNLSTDADSRTDKILERLREKKFKKMGRLTRPRVHATAPRVADGRSAPTPPF